jgi:hypothetical protein
LGGARRNPPSQPTGTFPLIQRHLECDSYFGINSTYAQRYVPGCSAITGLPLYRRGEEKLQWLNAVPIDLDVGHDGTQFCFECLRQSFLLDVQHRGLPTPSLIVSSGRGLWSLWRIADRTDRELPVKAFPDQCEKYRRTVRKLSQCFEHLGADRSVVDPARVMRIPQTFNTQAPESFREVRFYKVSEECHSLAELAAIIGVVERVRPVGPGAQRQKDGAKVIAGLERWRRPLAGFEELQAMRNHFVKGTRRPAIFVYALLLRRNRVPEDAILDRCRKLAESCKPPLEERWVRRCISSCGKPLGFERSISNHAIVRMLHITPEEKAAIPEWFGCQQSATRNKATDRQSLIKQELELAGAFTAHRKCWISTRVMSRILLAKHGVEVSHVTLTKDYRQLLAKHFPKEGSSVKGAAGKFPGG